MKFTGDIIDDISKNVRLNFSDTEKAEVIKFMDMVINDFDIKVEPVSKETDTPVHVNVLKNIFRQDTKDNSTPGIELLSNAPEQENGYYKVPKTV